MHPRFSAHVDPIFLYVIRLLERIGEREEPVPREEFNQIRSRIEAASAALGQSREWELARYALVSWIDEMLIFAEWKGKEWWENNTLEIELFRTRDASTHFFMQAKEASTLESRDALEVFYICVVLGFHGIYRDEMSRAFQSEHGSHFLQDLGLPPTRELWAKQVRASLQLQQGRPRIPVAPKPGAAPPLEEKFDCISAWLVTAVLTAALFFTSWYFLYTSSGPSPS
jgi:type VI secretion system protein ImpK